MIVEKIAFSIGYIGPAVVGRTTIFNTLNNAVDDYKKELRVYYLSQEELGIKNQYLDAYEKTPQRVIELRCTKKKEIEKAKTNTLIMRACPGAIIYIQNIKWLIEHSDAIIFIAEPQKMALENNKLYYDEMTKCNKERRLPLIVQLNKRDLPNTIGAQEFRQEFKIGEAVRIYESRIDDIASLWAPIMSFWSE